MQTNPAVEQDKNVTYGQKNLWSQSGGKEKVYGGNDLPMSQVLRSE